MPTRKYNKSKKKTIKRRKNKGGGGNFSGLKPPLTQITPPSKKKRVTFPLDLVTIKEISPREFKKYADDEIDEDKTNKMKNKWNKWNTQLQKKGKNEISFEDYTKKMGKILKRKENEEETEINTFISERKNRIPRKNKLTPLTMDEQLAIHIREDREKKAAKTKENEKKQSEHT